MKPLYLHGKEGMRVALDMPALKVKAPGRAETLYPLQRVSRVIASGPVEWSTEALLACAQRGITITFLYPDGAIRAYLFGESNQRKGLSCRLRDLLDRPDWQDRYNDWHRAMESRARLALIKRLGLKLNIAPPLDELGAILDERKHQMAPPAVCRFVEQRLQGMLRALVAQCLAEAGLNAERIRSLEDHLDLPQDLTRLLAWDLYLPVLELLSRWRNDQAPGVTLQDRELVQLFEKRSNRLQRLGHGVINRLHGWLVELCA